MDSNRSSSSSSSSSSPSSSKNLLEDEKPEREANAQHVTDQPGGYDPNRIPLSIFDRTNAAEWSSASNESLFSIHVGHNSFSVYGDPTKTDDYSKSGELLAYSPSPMLPPPSMEPPVQPSVSEPKPEPKEQEIPPSLETPNRHDAESGKSPNNSARSGRSTNSTHSFTFPILAEGVTSEPAKPDTEEQKIQNESQEKSNWYRYSWFSCFSYCTWCFPSTRSG